MKNCNLTLQEQINDISQNAFRVVCNNRSFGKVEVSSRPDISDFQCNGAMSAAKVLKKSPRDIAIAVVKVLHDNNDLFSVSIDGPGFINFTLLDKAVIQHFYILKNHENFLFNKEPSPPKIIIDFGGPNAAKAMHVGHLRSALIGQSLKNLFIFAGYEIEGDIHLGDWGLQMGQLIAEIQDRFPDWIDIRFTVNELVEWYPIAAEKTKSNTSFHRRARKITSQLQKGHPEYRALWKQMIDVSKIDIKKSYDLLDVEFEQWFGESRYQNKLENLTNDLLNSGLATHHDNAVIIHVSDDGSLPPLYIRNSDGGYGYGATDLATIDERTGDFEAELVLYVVDKRQSGHFRQVFLVAQKANYVRQAQLEHIPFGTINGKNGKPFKTRDGGVMRLDHLVEKVINCAEKKVSEKIVRKFPNSEISTISKIIGIGALKFAEVSHDRESDYIFDIDKFVNFEGKTGPYIQYACVRLTSLLEKAVSAGIKPGPITTLDNEARSIILTLDQFKNIIEKSISARKPHYLANHLFELTNRYNSFYANKRVLVGDISKDTKVSRISIALLVRTQLALGLQLLGIEIPAKM